MEIITMHLGFFLPHVLELRRIFKKLAFLHICTAHEVLEMISL